MALQEFEGAMVVVSHDRHLLRTTTDELYLVHDKKVELFKGDLDDYHKWLGEQQRIEKQAALSENKTHTISPSVNRKDQKRLEAEFRKKLTPFKKQISSSEKLMDKYNLQLQELENALTDSSLYEHDQKARLTEVLKNQRDIKEQLEEEVEDSNQD
jgi:ATP-binding cassette subfamily F protein 3